MDKKIKTGISILLLLIIMGMHISSAIDNTNKKEFFKVNKLEINPEETLEMIFDITTLEYDNFKIVLNSDIDVKDIYAKDNSNITVANNTNAINIEVDKTKMNLNEIKLYYPISKDIAIGTKIQFKAQILIDKETEEKENTSEVVEEVTKIITVIEKEDKKEEIENDKNKAEENNNTKNSNSNLEKQATSNKTNNINNQKITVNTKTNQSTSGGMANGNNETQAIYNGSDNNYLSELGIEGVELNTQFNKEKETYFININNTNAIDITAIAEDSKAKVKITGNTNIINGQNKILISVTAENGNVRYYRIFANCEEESNET